MSSVKRLIRREGGSQVKIVAYLLYGKGLTRSVSIHVLYRKTEAEPWSLANERPHPNYMQMTVDQYVKEGRSEMLKLVSVAEILSVAQKLHELKQA